MNEFTRKAAELADAWVVEAIHEALAAHTGKITSADGDAARSALLAHLEGGEQKPSGGWHAPGLGEVHNADHSVMIYCEKRDPHDLEQGYIIDDDTARRVAAALGEQHDQ